MRFEKLPIRALSPGEELLDELLRRRPHETEVADHAAAAIEHEDDRDWLDAVLEEREVLQLAVVVNLEVVAGEVGTSLPSASDTVT